VWIEIAREDRRTDREPVHSGSRKLSNLLRRSDTSGDDELPIDRGPSSPNKRKRIAKRRTVGEKINTRASHLLEASRISRDIFRCTIQDRRVADRASWKREVLDVSPCQDLKGLRHESAAHEAIHANLDGKAR
jgi:hypothetical protein